MIEIFFPPELFGELFGIKFEISLNLFHLHLVTFLFVALVFEGKIKLSWAMLLRFKAMEKKITETGMTLENVFLSKLVLDFNRLN